MRKDNDKATIDWTQYIGGCWCSQYFYFTESERWSERRFPWITKRVFCESTLTLTTPFTLCRTKTWRMLSVVVLSSLLVSLGSAASCQSITIFGGAFIPIGYCYEITILTFSASTKYTCGGETGVLLKEYKESGCKEENLENSTAITFDDPDIIYYDCESSVICDVTILEAATCSACTDNNGCTKNNLFNFEFGVVTNQCISIPQSYIDAYNANRTAYGKEETSAVAIQFECDESAGVQPYAYDDIGCTMLSSDQTSFQEVEEEAEGTGGSDEQFTTGCTGDCNGEFFDCAYISLTCAAYQVKTLIAVFVAMFISVSL